MDSIELSLEDREFVERQIKNGDYADANAVVHAALLLLSDAERTHEAWLIEVASRRDELKSGAVEPLSLEEARSLTRAHQEAARMRG